jgi:type 1 glutamine amidotransferase
MQILLATLAAAAVMGAADEKAPEDAIRVVIVTGVDYKGHKWQETAPAIRDVLEQDKRFQVTIAEDPDFLASDDLFQFDEVFLHFKNYDPLKQGEKAKENLTEFVKRGKGLVVFHFACGAFEDWPEFAELAGMVWDKKTTHDPRGPFTVQITDAKHPITRGMSDFEADDELYFCLTGERPVEILATARSKKTGRDHPMAFALEFGKGRVFHTPLGHDVKSIRMPGVQELLRRGCAWAAGQEP